MKRILILLVCTICVCCGCSNFGKLNVNNTPMFYSDMPKSLYMVTKVINDTMAYAVNIAGNYDYDDYDDYFDYLESECVIITNNQALYDGARIEKQSVGEYQIIGSWLTLLKTFPVIKFYEYDSLEFEIARENFIMQKQFYDSMGINPKLRIYPDLRLKR